MTEQEQRIAVAELCGVPAGQLVAWREQLMAKWEYEHAVSGSARGYSEKVITQPDFAPPDYLHDWNACHSMVNSLTPVRRLEWLGFMQDITLDTREGWFPARFATSTQSEWVEAFLRMHGKWKD